MCVGVGAGAGGGGNYEFLWCDLLSCRWVGWL